MTGRPVRTPGERAAALALSVRELTDAALATELRTVAADLEAVDPLTHPTVRGLALLTRALLHEAARRVEVPR